MGRKGADDFADCVIRRSSQDTIIRSKYIVLMVLISLACAAAISYILCERYVLRGMLTEDSFDVVSLELISCLCCFLNFTMYLICRRVRDHHERDIVWRRALIDYLSSYGLDVKRLENIDARASEGRHALMAIVSFILWFASVLLSVSLVLIIMVEGSVSLQLRAIFQVGYIMVLVQFICTLGTAVRYPARHDSLQVEFVDGMQPMLEDLGIHVDAMKPIAAGHGFLINLILFLVTFGLYALYMIGSSATRMNRHMFSQWAYEEKLLSEIMRVEGATGINVINAEQDPMMIVRLAKGFT